MNHFKEYIPQAFPHGRDLILDSEILMIDTHTGNPLPFGSLGIHKVFMHNFNMHTTHMFSNDGLYQFRLYVFGVKSICNL